MFNERSLSRPARWLLLAACLLPIRGWAEEDLFEPVRRDIRKAIEKKQAPSLAVAVVRDGRIVWEEAFGWADVDKQVPATSRTSYSIASISKPVTATALMLLRERGLLDLDQPANELIGPPGLTGFVGESREATVRRLANHTSGLPLHYQFFYADEPYPKPPFTESLRRYGRLMAVPGEEFQYANFGYGVLDHMVSLLSERSFAEFVREEIFRPAGMQDSAIGLPEGPEVVIAKRYASDGSVLPFYDFDHPGGSAVFSSAHDLALFAIQHLPPRDAESQAAESARRLLKPESLAEMQRGTAKIEDGRQYGIGWFLNEREHGFRTVSHSGGMGGVRCRLVLVPREGIAVVTLCNAGVDLPMRMAERILGALLPDYEMSRVRFPEHRPVDPGPPMSPPELTGYWRGTVKTYSSDRPLQMWVLPDGDIKLKLADELTTLLNQSRFRDGLLTGEWNGNIQTEDANRRPYHLHLRVRLRGDRLNGAVTAISTPAAKTGNALSNWVELTRVDTDPRTVSLFDGVSLAGWKVADRVDFEDHGAVSVQDGQIRLNAGNPATGIVWQGDPPRMDYELEFEAMRREGSDFFCGLTFPVGPDYLTLILGGWGGGVTGLSNLDGSSAIENETTGQYDFQANRWYAVRLRVTPNKIQAWLDGQPLVDADTAGRKLSIWWEQEPMRPLGIATWSTAGSIRHLRMKRL